MLSAKFRRYSSLVIVPLGKFVGKTGINPNVITLAGLLLSIAAMAAFALGNLLYALMLLVLMSFFDVLDGAVARAQKNVTKLGGYLDSVTDRYSDAFILIGIAMYLDAHYILIMVVIFGSILVSYSKARSENIIKKCDVGLAERAERLMVIMLATILAIAGIDLFYEALLLLAVLTHITVLQRVVYTTRNI